MKTKNKLFKHISLILSLVMLLSFTSCKKEETKTGLTSGTYTATAEGHNGPVTLEVVIDDNLIKEINVKEHKESLGISDVAFERIIPAIIDEQSVSVDAISGATYTSKAIIEAVTDALKQAGADIASFSGKKENTSSGKNIEYTADVIVIGGGGAGLAAAVSAAENGASVIVVEKMPKLGGNTIISGGGYNAADPELDSITEMNPATISTIKERIESQPVDDFEKELQDTVRKQFQEYQDNGSTTMFDSAEFHMLQTYNGGDYKGNPDLIRELCANAYPTMEWLKGLGMEFRDELTVITGGLWNRGHGAVESLGNGYINTAVNAVQGKNVEIYLDTTANELIVEDGRVTGVMATNTDGDIIKLNANNGVVLATGGFGANVDLREKYNTEWTTLDSSIPTTNHPGATGDGIIMSEKVDANLVGMNYIQMLPLGDPKNGSLDGKIGKTPADFIFINKDGKRFVAEDERRDVMTKALFEQPEALLYIIDDGDTYPSADTKTNFEITVGDLVDQGRVFMADSIEELAGLIDVDPAALKSTIEEYNNSIDVGNDALFGKKTLGNKIDKAPFYACPRVPTVHHTMGGVEINTEAQVVDTKGNIIPGLYAAGEVTGGIHGTNRLGGNAITDTQVFGRLAGKNAANNK